MGNQIAKLESNETLLNLTKAAIVDKCEAYLDFVEDTKATVDTGIKELSGEISAIISKFMDHEQVLNLDSSTKLDLETDLFRFVNMHKFSIRRMLSAFHEAHNSFADMLDVNVHNKPDDENRFAQDSDSDSSNHSEGEGNMTSSFAEDHEKKIGTHSEDDLFSAAYSFSSKVVGDYEVVLDEIKFPIEYKSKRVSRFRRLMYKSFDLAISESIELAIYGRKESAFFRIDAAFRSGLEVGAFSGNEVLLCREVIQDIIQIANEEIHKLIQMPYLNEIAIDLATRDILSYSISAVRQCQLCYSTDPQSLVLLMDNEFDNYFHSEDISTTSDNEETPDAKLAIEDGSSRAPKKHSLPTLTSSLAVAAATVSSAVSSTASVDAGPTTGSKRKSAGSKRKSVNAPTEGSDDEKDNSDRETAPRGRLNVRTTTKKKVGRGSVDEEDKETNSEESGSVAVQQQQAIKKVRRSKL